MPGMCGRSARSLRSGQVWQTAGGPALSEANGTPALPLFDPVPLLIELIELGLVVREIDHLPADKFRHHVRLGVERHAVEDDQVGLLALLQAAQTVIDAEEAGRINGDRLERRLLGQAARDGVPDLE